MRSYDEYIQQNPQDVQLFEYARTGNLLAVRKELAENHSLDINLKDHKGYSALMYAAYNGHKDLVITLIAQGADIESPDKGGSTILMGVAFKGHTEIAEILIEAGADIHATNFTGMTALQFAQMFGRNEIIALLSQHEPGYFTRKYDQLRTWGYYLSQKLQFNKET
ncbi:MAG: ankyrin repeat domain-containing protein [Bdellovibrionales bacterium]|nr:ankyrin repeat domain-containing protein [Bdellovibrionales bacterium]